MRKVNDEGLGEWMKCGEAALMDVDEGAFDGAAMAYDPTAMAPLLTHNARASLLDPDRLMIVSTAVRRRNGSG